MHKIRYASLFFFFTLFSALVAHAQGSAGSDSNRVDMADALRANGKIYVVVAVVVTILLGLILFVVRLDRKIGRMEKK